MQPMLSRPFLRASRFLLGPRTPVGFATRLAPSALAGGRASAAADAPGASAPVVEAYGPGDAPAWDAYVQRRPDATLYHLRAWKEAAELGYGMEAPFLLARDRPGGVVRGVLPLFR